MVLTVVMLNARVVWKESSRALSGGLGSGCTPQASGRWPQPFTFSPHTESEHKLNEEQANDNMGFDDERTDTEMINPALHQHEVAGAGG